MSNPKWADRVVGWVALGGGGLIILLLVALSYSLAGVHVDRRLLWVSAAVAGCYLLTVYQRDLPRLWTITAAALAASLAVAGIVAAARARREA